MRVALSLAACCLVAGCTQPVTAVVDPARSTHFLDAPFPSDTLRDGEGFADLTGFPEANTGLLANAVAGWVSSAGRTTQGFANNGAAYFRFEAPLDLPTETTGAEDDPVLLIDMETGERLPLLLRIVEDPADDPFYGPNTLALAPALGHPPRSGAQLAAVVMRRAGVAAPDDYELPDGVEDALDLAEVKGRAAVATVFTVQDATGQLEALFTDVDDRLGASPDWSAVVFRRVVQLEYRQGQTPSGEDATLAITTFEGGATETAYLSSLDEEAGNHTTDLLDEWPMAVYQADLPVFNYSGLDDRPYMNPSVGHLLDVGRDSGWIEFASGELVSEPDPETTRIVIQLPVNGSGIALTDVPIVMYDHGTGGHAYNSVQRRHVEDLGIELATRFADAGFAVIGRDAPLYGTRYPLVDTGFTDGSLGFYNIINLPAFRDNQRQTAVEGHILRRFIETGLNDALPDGSVDSTRVRRIGHSLGSVTAHLGLSGEPDQFEAALQSGSGGVFAHYFLDTGLLQGESALMDTIAPIFGLDPEGDVSIGEVVGAAIGIEDEAALQRIDRLHPVVTVFQWLMDPSDPMAVSRDVTVPETILLGINDYQVPNFTSRALGDALPNATVIECTPTWDYDPHYCLHRETEGFEILESWLAQ